MSEYKVQPVLLTGLDIETTGIDLYKNHRLIQIGVAIWNGPRYVFDVQPEGHIAIDPGAMKVNGFTLRRMGEAPMTAEVDYMLSKSLAKDGFTEGQLTPVGFNVGGFDLPFIKKELPLVAKFFSYRALDLTGLAILYELKTGRSYRDLKEEFHTKIVKELGKDQRHDALYDAEAALIAVQLFKELN